MRVYVYACGVIFGLLLLIHSSGASRITAMTARPQVLVIGVIPEIALKLLQTKCDVKRLEAPSREEILDAIQECDALYGSIVVDAAFLDSAGSRLKIISTPSAGYDKFDIAEIKKRGIKVGHTPKVLSAAVAEIAVFLLLGATRRTHEGRRALDGGKESVNSFHRCFGHDLRNKTVGIVGLGNIGQNVLTRLKPFEIKKFLYTGHSRKKIGDELGAEFVSMNELVTDSDFIVNCLPLTAETEKIFTRDLFKRMKNTAVFVNVGRGKTVDTEALTEALKDNTIFAAGLDVTDPEPLPVDHELMKLPNAVIIPHMGSQTIETRTDMAMASVQNILNGIEGKPLLYEL